MEAKELVKKFEKNQEQMLAVTAKIEQAVATEIKKLNKLKDQDKEMRQAIKVAMEENGITKFDGELVTITYRKPSKRSTFDSKRFKEERPRMYEKYIRTSEVAGSVTILPKA